MVKRHLKRINTPKTWKVQRRGIKFITRSNPGGMAKEFTMPVSNILKYELQLANTIKEVKHIIKDEEILVNSRKITDYRYPVCFTDVISFPKSGQYYRLIMDRDGILKLITISKEESQLKIIKIIGKSFVDKKLQLNLMDGRNIFFEKQHYKVNDSLLITIPDQLVKEHLALEKGALVLLYKGKHVGKIGAVLEITQKTIKIKEGEDVFETKKDYVMVVGKDRPVIKITK